MNIVTHEPNLLALVRELYSRRPETRDLEPWELQHILFSSATRRPRRRGRDSGRHGGGAHRLDARRGRGVSTEKRRRAAAALIRRGVAVIPVPAGEKNPGRPGWEALRITEEEIPDYWTNGQNVGVLCGEPSAARGRGPRRRRGGKDSLPVPPAL